MKKIIISVVSICMLLAPNIISVMAFDTGENISQIIMEPNLANNEEPFDGYILFTPWFGQTTYLIDKDKKVVNKWSSFGHICTTASYLMENGNLIRANRKLSIYIPEGGATGRIEIFDWNGTRIWNFEYSNLMHCLHHDICPLPNGNILMIAWGVKTRDQAIKAGIDPDNWDDNELFSSKLVDYIIEVKPTGFNSGDIVWEWHIWDHLIQDFDQTKDNYGAVEDHLELLDINNKVWYGAFNHINSIDYNEEFDQILLSSLNQDEIWIIDHSTTTQEAASHTGGNSGKGGDFLYRWGNPQIYRAGNASDQRFFGQHDARWIEPGCPGEGHITVVNNQYDNYNGFSSVDEIIPPVDSNGDYYLDSGSAYGPEEPIWRYTADNPYEFYGTIGCSAQRLPDGNTLINSFSGIEVGRRFFEVNYEKEVVWDYLLDEWNIPFSVQGYTKDYPGIGDLSTETITQSTLLLNQQDSQPVGTTQQSTTGSTTESE